MKNDSFCRPRLYWTRGLVQQRGGVTDCVVSFVIGDLSGLRGLAGVSALSFS